MAKLDYAWSRTTRVIVLGLVLILAGLFLYLIRSLLSPLIIAALLAYALYPLVTKVQTRTRQTYKSAVMLVYFPFLLLLIAIPGALAPFLIQQIQTLSEDFVLIVNQINILLTQPITIFNHTISAQVWSSYLNLTPEGLAPMTENAIHVLEATSTSLIWLVLIIVSVYYLLHDWESLLDWLLHLGPPAERPHFLRLLQGIDRTWRAYLRGTLALMFIMTVFFVVVGLAIGLPGAIALGLLTGLLSIIPELGPAIAAVLSTAVALFLGSNYLPISNFWFAVLVAGIFLVVMQIKSLWLRPIVMGRFMHMNTGLVFVAVIGAVLLSGILAALIVLPVIASVAQVGHYVRCRILNLDPWEEPSSTAVPPLKNSPPPDEALAGL